MNNLLPHRSIVLRAAALAAVLLLMPSGAEGRGRTAPAPEDDSPKLVRELFVPVDDISVLLQSQPDRVLLTREEFEALRRQAETARKAQSPGDDADLPPAAVLLNGAAYNAKLEEGRAVIRGTLSVSVLREGLQGLPLPISGVGIRSATLDGEPAALGQASAEDVMLFLEGVGMHELSVELVSSVPASAATQVLSVRLPMPPSTRLKLDVPGNVELRSGAAVLSREFDEAAQRTRFALLPADHSLTLALSLNNRFQQDQGVVVSRAVVVNEVTESAERLHATFAMTVLHRPVDEFRFAVPAGFEVGQVLAGNLASWSVAEAADGEGGGQLTTLVVRLREPASGRVLVHVGASRSTNVEALSEWQWRRLRAIDVAGEVAIFGMLLEHGLKLDNLLAGGLMPIDAHLLLEALPPTMAIGPTGRRMADTPPLRPVFAYYLPAGGAFNLTGRISKPAGKLRAEGETVVRVDLQQWQADGSFTLRAEHEEVFAFTLAVPAGWHLDQVRDGLGEPLDFTAVEASDEDGETSSAARPQRFRVTLKRGVAAGRVGVVRFRATWVPPGWLEPWSEQTHPLPVFAVPEAHRSPGTLVLVPHAELRVASRDLKNLRLMDAEQLKSLDLADALTTGRLLAYRYDHADHGGEWVIRRVEPRLTAKAYHFLRLEDAVIDAHHELVYRVRSAATDRLAFDLPLDTPANITLSTLPNRKGKTPTIIESLKKEEDGRRRWTVLLGERYSGELRLAVSYRQPVPAVSEITADYAMPLAVARDVAYQSGLVAVQGDPELLLTFPAPMRRVDVGEMSAARYRPADRGRSATDVFTYIGDPAAMKVAAERPPQYHLPIAVIERAELVTVLSDQGVAQTAARFSLRCKAVLLELSLPPGSSLWSATVHNKPVKPQRQGDRLLIPLSDLQPDALVDVQVVFETPMPSTGLWSSVALTAPGLAVRDAAAGSKSIALDMADLQWNVFSSAEQRIVDTAGTLAAERPATPKPALEQVIDWVGHSPGWLLAGVGARYQTRPSKLVLESVAEPDESGAGFAQRAAAPRERKSLDGLAYMGDDDDSFKKMQEQTEHVRQALVEKRAKELLNKGELADQPSGGMPAMEEAIRADILPAVPGKTRAEREAASAYWALEGVSSLRINLATRGGAVTLRSLGGAPALTVTLAAIDRVQMLAWALAVLVGLFGLRRHNRGWAARARYMIAVCMVATLLPMLFGQATWLYVTNPSFFVAAALLPAFLLLDAGKVAWRSYVQLMDRGFGRRSSGDSDQGDQPKRGGAVPATPRYMSLLLLGGVIVLSASTPAVANDDPARCDDDRPFVPLAVPADAIIVPYDSATAAIGEVTISPKQQLLVPADLYRDLWNTVHHDPVLDLLPVSRPFVPAGGSYRAVLADEDIVEFRGSLSFHLFAEQAVKIPLAMKAGVLLDARLDGSPASLHVEPQAAAGKGETSGGSLMSVVASGRGLHKLDLVVRVNTVKEGGWRGSELRLPGFAGTGLTLQVPHNGTEVRLIGVEDRQIYETTSSDQTIETALPFEAPVMIAWRPPIREGDVVSGLKARSSALLDLRDDGLRLIWKATLDFGRTETDNYRIRVPAGYRVERIDGPNVRGWNELHGHAATNNDGGERYFAITLLKAVKAGEELTVVMHRHEAMQQEEKQVKAPYMSIVGAELHTGQLSIRRSPLLDVSANAGAGLSRSDMPHTFDNLLGAVSKADANPLGILPAYAYRFALVPFDIDIDLKPRPRAYKGSLRTVLRFGEDARTFETEVTIEPLGAPIFDLQFALSSDVVVQGVTMDGAYDWTRRAVNGGQRLLLSLPRGKESSFSFIIRGRFDHQTPDDLTAAVPTFDLLGAADPVAQWFALQTDPSFDIRVRDLRGLHRALGAESVRWLRKNQQELFRLSLKCLGGDYAGTMHLMRRQPEVVARSTSNVRVTRTAIIDTILLNYEIRQAGIREVSFILPAYLAEARIFVPLLRERSIELLPADHDRVLVRLLLQDEVTGELRVLIEHDRLVNAEQNTAPIPALRDARVDRQYVVLESSGRDEVVVDDKADLDALTPGRKEHRDLVQLLGPNLTEAYVVNGPSPRFAFHTSRRETVDLGDASIGLAQALVVVDASGTYRAAQTYLVHNETEQFLDVTLPAGATLWSVVVSEQPVKPIQAAKPKGGPRAVRVPLVKSPPGELDYPVTLVYGGRLDIHAGWQATDFAFIEVENIPVELSQARLFLPQDYQWFDFSGTMRHVKRESDLLDSAMSYVGRSLDRVAESLKSQDEFARNRAVDNATRAARGQILSNLQAGVQTKGAARHAGRGGRQGGQQYQQVQQQIDERLSELMQGEQQAEVSQEDRGSVAGNAYYLNDAYERQNVMRSFNRLADLEKNFAGPQQQGQQAQQRPALQQKRPAQQAESAARFDRNWIGANRIGGGVGEGRSALGVVMVLEDGSANPNQVSYANIYLDDDLSLGLPAIAGAKSPLMQETPQGPGQTQAAPFGLFGRDEAKMEESRARESRRRGRAQNVPARQEGQEQLGQSLKQIIDKGVAQDSRTYEYAAPVTAGDVFQMRSPASETAMPASAAQTLAGYGATADSAGLASLDIGIPTRGRAFYFTTTGGDMKITARAVSQRWQRTGRVLGLLLIFLIVLWLFAQLARLFTRWRRVSGLLLVAAGMILLCAGVWPILAGLGLLAGAIQLAGGVQAKEAAAT